MASAVFVGTGMKRAREFANVVSVEYTTWLIAAGMRRRLPMNHPVLTAFPVERSHRAIRACRLSSAFSPSLGFEALESNLQMRLATFECHESSPPTFRISAFASRERRFIAIQVSARCRRLFAATCQ